MLRSIVRIRRPVRAFVIAALLLGLAAIPGLAFDPLYGTGNSDVSAQNMGDRHASVYAHYYDTSGSVADTRTAWLPPRVSQEFSIEDTALPDGFLGNVVLSADQELAAVSEIVWTGGTLYDGIAGAAYMGQASGARDVFLPEVYQMSWKPTTIVVQNTESQGRAISMYYYWPSGDLAAGPINDFLPGGGGKVYDLTNIGGKVPDLGGHFAGSMRIAANTDIAVVVVNQAARYSCAYSGLPNTGTTRLAIPVAYRWQTASGRWYRHSSIVVQNLHDTSASLSLTFRSQDRSAPIDVTFTDWIPPRGTHTYDTKTGGSVAASTFNPLGYGWTGTVKIESTNGRPIVAIATTYICNANSTAHKAATFAAFSADLTTQEVYAPSFYRLRSGGAWENLDSRWSEIYIQNLSESNLIKVNLYLYRRGYSTTPTLVQTLWIEPAASRGKRTTWPFFAGLGNLWAGSVYLASTGPIAVSVMTDHYNLSGAYEGYGE